MGEAKRRGTYEQRRAAAIERNGIEREEYKRIVAERLAAETEEARQRRRDQQMKMAQITSACLAVGVVPYILPDRR